MKATKTVATKTVATSTTKSITFDDFKPNPDLGENKRGAEFVDWCAKNMPGRFIPYVQIAKQAYFKPKVPKLDNSDVVTLRKQRMTAIKDILWKEYHRRTLAAPRDQEPGMRATTDSDDLAGTDYLRRTRRIASGVKAAAETREKIDTEQMRNVDLKNMVERTDPIMKQLVKADLMKRLELPPKRDD